MNTCSFRHCERKATHVLILQYEVGERVEVEVTVCQRHADWASNPAWPRPDFRGYAALEMDEWQP
jgi:hypothetical protein